MSRQCAFIIDLRSDTVTKPTDTMKQAMVTAELGDDVYGEDPTVNALEAKVAKLLGKQAALFVPSGTMANLLAVMVHCNKRGAEILVGDKSHIYLYEQGGASQVANVMVSTLRTNSDGTFDLQELEARVRGKDLHSPITHMVAVENTHNMCGGKVLPLDYLDKLSAVIKKHSLSLHMDGARLFNAAEYLGEDPSKLVKHCDSISVCFSKGLGAPVGSALVGTYQFITQARRLRKVLGGGMRQSGVLAAAALVALDEIVPALGGDHRRTMFLANAIHDLKLPSFKVDPTTVQTNILMLSISPDCAITSDKLSERLAQISLNEVSEGCATAAGEGIVLKVGSRDSKTVRVVLHFQISDEHVRLAVKKFSLVLKEMECNKKYF